MLLFLFVHGCVPQPIEDLRLVEISRLPASALPPSDSLREALTERGKKVWKVSLSGDANWIEEVGQHELNPYATIVRCGDRDQNVLSLGPYVGHIRVSDYGEGFRDFRPQSGTVRYDIFLPETGRYQSERDPNAPMPSYDLGMERMELCIRIAGGAMLGAYSRSNEVRVEVGGTP